MLTDKRGYEAVALKPVLGAVTLVVLVALVITSYEDIKTVAGGVVCDVTSWLADKFFGLISPVCFTYDIVSDETEEDEIKKEIADYMTSCFNQWGRGEGDPAGEGYLEKSGTQCFNCFRLSYPEFDGTISAQDFRDFLRDEDYRNKDSYWNYFKVKDDNIRVIVNINGGVIQKDKFYGVVYMEGVSAGFLRSTVMYGVAGVATAGVAFYTLGTPLGWATVAGGTVAGGGILKVGGDYILNHFEAENKKPIDGIMFVDYNKGDRFCGGELGE